MVYAIRITVHIDILFVHNFELSVPIHMSWCAHDTTLTSMHEDPKGQDHSLYAKVKDIPICSHENIPHF